jgi:hypothetical protein
VPEKLKQSTQATYSALAAQKGVIFDFKLVDRDRVENGAVYLGNLPLINKQLQILGRRPEDKVLLFVLTTSVGEKDRKLLMLVSKPAN